MSSNLVGCTIFELKRGREVKFAISFFVWKKQDFPLNFAKILRKPFEDA